MRHVLGAVLLVFAVLAQATWASRLEVAGAFPNFVLLSVVTAAWAQGTRAGLVWGCAGGLLLDLTSTGPVGPHAFALLVPVYAIGFWTRSVVRASAIHVVFSVGLATIVYSLIVVTATGMLGGGLPSPAIVGQLTLAAAVYNAALSPFAVACMGRGRSFALGTISRRAQA